MIHFSTRFSFGPLSLRSAISGAFMWGALCLGCEEEPKKVTAPVQEPEPPPAPKIESPPSLRIDAGGPVVRGMSAIIEDERGNVSQLGLSKLDQYLSDEKKFITDQAIEIEVDRRAKPTQVALFVNAVGKLSPKEIVLGTDTRSEFPKKLKFVPQSLTQDAEGCSLLGTILEDRGTAIWTIAGGTAHKRKRGMGGPDLTMTADTIDRMSEKCDSDLFFVTAVEGVEWGLVYDLAAAGISSKKAGLSRAVIPEKEQTAGHALSR